MGKSNFVYEEIAEDGGWKMKVVHEGEHVGNVFKNPNGGYNYFAGAHNYATLSFEHKDLEELKKKIEKTF